MLTIPQVQEHLARLTYKPGWAFAAYHGEWEGPHLVITTTLPNAYPPGDPITLDVHSALPPMPDADYLHRWIAWRLVRIETHEMREFLRVDGLPLFDPHTQHADRDSTTYSPS